MYSIKESSKTIQGESLYLIIHQKIFSTYLQPIPIRLTGQEYTKRGKTGKDKTNVHPEIDKSRYCSLRYCAHRLFKGAYVMLERIFVRVHKRIIGLVEIKGVIFSSKPYVDEIERFRKIPNVKAVVLRVDSPGGAVVPAQEIYEAIQKAKKDKPVVVSMGSISASGGYYLASAANKIFASPGTITGSIGVAMHIRNIQELFTKIGIGNSIIKSGEFKDLGSPFRKMTPKEETFLQGVADDIYQQFVEAVAKGRKLSVDQLKTIADGQIFTGKKAKELGLVDEIGSLQQAISETGKMVGIVEEPYVVSFKRRKKILSDYVMNKAFSHLLLDMESRLVSFGPFSLIAQF
jgi:protease IV